MKKIAIILIAVLVLASMAFSEDATPKTKEGDKAWMFSFSGLGNLGAGSYMGGVGGKYYFQDNMALRAGLSFSTTDIPDVDKDPSSFGLNAGLQYDYSTNGAVVAYFGGNFMYSTSKTQGSDKSDNTFGIGGLAGVEWFPYNNISLSAEYMLSFESTKSAATDKTTSTIMLGKSGASLNLCVFF